MTWLRRAGRQTFRSLEVPNYRKYTVGQLISASGNWVQQTALTWLVIRMTDSNGLAVGTVVALQFLPMLLGGAWSGLLADRVDKRRLLFLTSGGAAAGAGAMGVLVIGGAIQLWMVYLLALTFGVANALDNPARRSFVTELVPDHLAANAVSLNSSIFTAARIVGPAIAAAAIATVGIGWCFVINAASFGAVIVALALMDVGEINPSVRVTRDRGQLVDGLRHVWANPALKTSLLLTAVVGTMAFNFQVTVSLMVRKVFDGGADTFAGLLIVMSVGAVLASLLVAHRERVTSRFVAVSSLALGGFMLIAAAAPTTAVFAIVLFPTGAASIAFLSSAGALAQSRAAPEYRGRVAALFAVAFLGSTPIGAPLIGAISQAFGPRAGLVVGGATAIVASTFALSTLARRAAAIATMDISPARAA